MKLLREHRWFYLPVAIFLALGALVVVFVPYGNEIIALNPLRQEPLNSIFKFFTWCGEPGSWFAVGLTLLLLGKYRFAVLIAAAGLFTIPLSYISKDKIGTSRPATYFADAGKMQEVVTVPGVELNLGQTSFPSGHTMSAFGLYGLLALMSKRKQWYRQLALALLAILVGISRIFLVQHFMVDVAGGAVLGLGVSALAWAFNGRLMHYLPK